MNTLVIAEHDNNTLKPATHNAVSAAQAIGGDIDILVAGVDCGAAAEAAAARKEAEEAKAAAKAAKIKAAKDAAEVKRKA